MTRHYPVTPERWHNGREGITPGAAEPRKLALYAQERAAACEQPAGLAHERSRAIRGPRAEIPSGGEHTLVLVGDLNHASAHVLEAEIEDLCAAGMSRIALDLRRLASIDWAGARVIVFRSELCRARGHELELIPGPRPIQRVFDRAGLTERLPFRKEPPSRAEHVAVADVADLTARASVG
jgi:anti-anti-sigma factor